MLPQDGEFLLGAYDIDREGHADLLLATSRGAANTFADYWMFVPGTQDFRYLGNYPLFTVDTLRRRLKTYERGGEGGMIFEANQYEFRGGALTLVESERQEATSQAGVYRRIVRQLRNGKLEQVSSERVRAPAR